MSRKQINLLLSSILVLLSISAVILFDEKPQALKPTKEVKSSFVSLSPSPTPTPSLPLVTPYVDSTGQNFYEVVKVVDGDTIDVMIDGKKERLRLIGIDTPETVDPRKEVGCFGKEASNKGHELLDGKLVSLEPDPTQGERDKYKRLLRYVFRQDGLFYNKYMIEQGYAHEYTYDLPYKYQEEFKQAEKEARENSRGFWNPSVCPTKQ